MIDAPSRTVALTPEEARSALAAEWASRAPVTEDDITEFYRESEHLAADLDAFHSDPTRQSWTRAIVYLAQTQGIRSVVDIGCGAGHDLRALADVFAMGADLFGVEPNDSLREQVAAAGFPTAPSVEYAPIETADMLVCIDVLEHIPDPESWLTAIAQRAPIGCWLTEATATHDCGTPLHLKENRGWQPGRALEGAGWERLQTQGRFNVWRRVREAVEPRATLMLFAYRSVSVPTFRSILQLTEAERDAGWRVTIGSEAGIHRSRNIAASTWYANTADDVFVMVDGDITFNSQDVARLVDRCRNGYPLICGAYPKRDGSGLALRGLSEDVYFGADLEPIEIGSLATGFVAVHRSVLDAIIPSLPLCHPSSSFAHWPMFNFENSQDSDGNWEHLSEDYYFSKLAREHGFPTYLDRSIFLGHLGEVEIGIRNMQEIHAATQIVIREG
jgi:hypothetical protein